MTPAERAKQFQPFSALRGLEEALLEKEREIAEKKELTEDMAEKLNSALQNLSEGKKISVLFFNDGSIERIAGEVTKIDKIQKRMTIENRIIAFNDLMEIENNVY